MVDMRAKAEIVQTKVLASVRERLGLPPGAALVLDTDGHHDMPGEPVAKSPAFVWVDPKEAS